MARTRFFVIMMSLVITALLPASGTPASPEPRSTVGTALSRPTKESPGDKWEKLVADAKKEAKLAVYANATHEVRRALSEAFARKYGIEVEFIMGSGSELASKLLAERRANLNIADVLLGGATTATGLLKPAGLLAPVEPLIIASDINKPELWMGGRGPFVDKDKMIAAMIATFERYLLGNVALVTETEITSFTDLLKPQYKGKMVATDPSTSGTGNAWVSLLVNVWGEEKAKEFLRKFVKQEPILSRDRRLVVEWVSKGKYSLAVAPQNNTTAAFLKMGAPIKYLKVKEGGSLGSGAGCLQIAVSRPHPAATALFVNWLLSKEGQTVYSKAFGHPSARVDVPKEGFRAELFPDPGESMTFQTEEEILQRVRLVGVAKNIILLPL